MSTIVDKRNLAEELRTAFYQQGHETNASKRESLEIFMQKGLPGQKTEEYKFTPITRTLEKVFALSQENSGTSSPSAIPAGLPADFKGNIIRYHNGRYSQELSVIVDSELSVRLTKATEPNLLDDPFDLLNHAFSNEFVEITVAAEKTIGHPVVVLYSFDSADFVFSNPRWKCSIGEKSSLTVIEQTVSTADTKYFNNKQSRIQVAAQANLEYIIIENSDHDIFVGNSFVDMAKTSRAYCYTFTFAGQLIRNNLTMTINGEGVDAHLFGLYLLSQQTLADNHTVVDHQTPNSFSNELYKGVMDGNSKGVFNGKIYVRPHAQKTNAFQSNRNILLSESATINTKPQLEIWADDVKCSHGCTTGQLDEDALFYLRSRGISKDLAKGMMLYAFAAETLATMKNEPIRNFIDELIAEKLNKNF